MRRQGLDGAKAEAGRQGASGKNTARRLTGLWRLGRALAGRRAVSTLGSLAAALLVGAPAQVSAHTINICWLVHGNGDVQFFAGTYHDPSEGLSGGLTINGTRHTFTASFGGNINELGITNCQAGFDSEGGIVADPCGSGYTILHWQTVTVSGLTTGTYDLSISSDSAVEQPIGGNCYPVNSLIDVDDPCAAFGDDDGDNVCNPQDGCPADPNKGTPGVCGCGVPDTDSDSDGTPDCNDGCPDDSNKQDPGVCGCGVADSAVGDSDSDGTADCNDGCPNDPDKVEPGVCGCGVPEEIDDSDADGVPACHDSCPNDPDKQEPGICGCGISDQDSDLDGVADCHDLCLGNDATGDADGDGLCTDIDHRALVTVEDFTGAQGPCTEGGSFVTVGIDENNDGQLVDDEVKGTSYICHGVTGVDGLSTLIAVSPIDPGATCPTGGFELRYGVDDDRSGTLESGEQDGTHTLCAGLNSAIRVEAIAAGDAQCGSGGIFVSYGIDDDGNGTLDDGEVDGSERVCHGLTALVKTSELSADPSQCAFGGVLVQSGLDKNGSGALDDAEVTSEQVICNGTGLAVRTTTLEVGSAACPAGGTQIDVGIDLDGDNALSDAEVQHTNRLCEATLVLFETETLADKSKECPHGGVLVKMGHDDGQPAGVAGDGTLQSSEVESTKAVCLAPTDVLIKGGSSSCSAAGTRGQGPGWLFMALLTLGAVHLGRRRRAH